MRYILLGPTKNNHTNYWFFLGLYKALLYRKYNVFWTCYNNYNLNNEKIIFITDNFYDNNIPLSENYFYILFENNKEKYQNYNKLHINRYNKNIPEYCTKWKDKDCIYYSLENRELYFPLATELLPNEILENQQKHVLNHISHNNLIFYIGDIKNNSSLYGDIKLLSNKLNYRFCVCNNFDIDKRKEHLIKSHFVLILSNDDEINNEEINEKVFQVISYGGFPITNNDKTASLFNNNSIYCDNNCLNIMYEGINKRNEYDDIAKWNSMEYVKNEHTYLQRLNVIIWILERIFF